MEVSFYALKSCCLFSQY